MLCTSSLSYRPWWNIFPGVKAVLGCYLPVIHYWSLVCWCQLCIVLLDIVYSSCLFCHPVSKPQSDKFFSGHLPAHIPLRQHDVGLCAWHSLGKHPFSLLSRGGWVGFEWWWIPVFAVSSGKAMLVLVAMPPRVGEILPWMSDKTQPSPCSLWTWYWCSSNQIDSVCLLRVLQ